MWSQTLQSSLVAEGRCDWAFKPHPLSVKPALYLTCSTGALSAFLSSSGQPARKISYERSDVLVGSRAVDSPS